MLRNIALAFFTLLLSFSFSLSQTISGYVIDENKAPVIGASVFFDGTSIGTITNAAGKFSISVNNKINSPLVISFLGYETHIIQNAFDYPEITIQLIPKPFQIKAVVVKKDRFSRKQKMKIFKEQFLGITKAGKSCEIKNESDIYLNYNQQNNTLYASSDKPLIITNKHLGYSITANLVDFEVAFNQTSIKREHIKSGLYLVTTLFTDISDNNNRYSKRRNNSYLGSPLHFFRTLSNNTWGEKSFTLYNGSFPALPNQYFSVTDTLDLKKVEIESTIKGMVISMESNKSNLPFISSFNVLFNNRKQSKVIFRTNKIYIDKNGNNTSPELIQFGGEMGKKRLGDMVPFDFYTNI